MNTLKEAAHQWSVEKLQRHQPRPYFVCRNIGTSWWEQLRLPGGVQARFETRDEAQHAADVANAGDAND